MQALESCERGSLTAQELQVVVRAAQIYNLHNCLAGLPQCDLSRLSALEQKEAAIAKRSQLSE